MNTYEMRHASVLADHDDEDKAPSSKPIQTGVLCSDGRFLCLDCCDGKTPGVIVPDGRDAGYNVMSSVDDDGEPIGYPWVVVGGKPRRLRHRDCECAGCSS